VGSNGEVTRVGASGGLEGISGFKLVRAVV
jgi:hypothetical protein